jgi:acetyl esterase/lipase
MERARTSSHRFAVIALLLLTAACTGAGNAGPSDTTVSTVAPDCRESPSGPVTHQYAVREGADPDRTSLDVYLPAGCGPAPVVVWVHGGGWRRGDKTAGQVQRKADWAASLGAALVAVNYRLSVPGSGVMWPDHGRDVSAAVAWVQREGASVELDPARMTLLGHSAGAHLVAIVATHPTLLDEAGADPALIACVIPLDFSFDLATAPARSLIANAFGGDTEVLEDASPNVQIARSGPPRAAFLVGTRGGPRRVADARDFVALINESGGYAALLDANPYSHDGISAQLGAPGEQIVTPTVSDFASSCSAE